eukprot:CAMPEP_0170159968 /NCGR_PEP_ID=MMETSP0033_2-20121228/72198_1 /TAXON_ID=195969 /ORGANISM="Dolichomastix tenuilepis, Strain CCMP3274" /LENGTH=106 /DNA_ID=CAMNT_0010397491 /DNA_START=297 /DNA_END=614 /DNA_ORIENTATION=+
MCASGGKSHGAHGPQPLKSDCTALALLSAKVERSDHASLAGSAAATGVAVAAIVNAREPVPIFASSSSSSGGSSLAADDSHSATFTFASSSAALRPISAAAAAAAA